MRPKSGLSDSLPAILTLILGGLFTISVAVSPGLFGLAGAPGFGAKQWALSVLGGLALASGVFLASAAGRRFVARRAEAGGGQVPEPTSTVLLLAIALGILAGWADVALLSLQRALGQRFVHLNPHAIWMAPVSYSAVLVALALVLSCLAALGFRRVASLPVACSTFSFVSLVGLLFLFHPELHPIAILLVAGGFAIQAARVAARHAPRFRVLVRRTAGAWVVAAVLLTMASMGLRAWRERGARAALVDAPEGSPNVLLVIWDTVRAQSLSLYGYERTTTPALERLASSGTVFERAFAPASWTLQSHASMFTGRWPHDLSAGWLTPLDRTYPTLAEELADRGYATAGFVANKNYCGLHTGLNRGFVHYDADLVSVGETITNSSIGRLLLGKWWRGRPLPYVDHHHRRKRGGRVTAEFLDWLSRAEGRPFFVFLNYVDAHRPYRSPPAFHTRFAGRPPPREFQVLPALDSLGRSRVAAQRDAYDGAISFLDHELQRLATELKRRGELDRTLLIVASDHGEELGENGIFGHGLSLHLSSLRVPLLIRFPGRVPAGLRVEEAVSLRDIEPTVLDLLGTRPAVPAGESGRGLLAQARSLTRFWSGGAGSPGLAREPLVAETDGRTWLDAAYPASRGDMVALVRGGLHYIRNGDGEEFLYRYDSDPWEQIDVAGERELSGELALFRAWADSLVGAARWRGRGSNR